MAVLCPLKYILLTVVLIGGLEVTGCDYKDCYGYTFPKNDIRLEVGSNLTITCVLTDANYNSSDIIWLPEQFTKGHVTTLNSTARQLFIPNVTAQHSDLYHCKVKNLSVDRNDVKIGYKASVDIPFNCTINFNKSREMVCNWEPPPNKISTDYNVSFTRNKERKICSRISNGMSSCIVNHNDIPDKDIIRLEFYASNALNTAGPRWYNFTRCGHVIFTNNSALKHEFNHITATVKLKFPDIGDLVCGGYSIICEITLKNSSGSWKYSIHNITNVEHYYTFESLNPFTDYELTVAYQMSNSSFPDYWKKDTLTFKSEAAVPAYPPLLNSNGFSALKDGTKIIYWKPVPEMDRNGGNFCYVVKCGNVTLGTTEDCFYRIKNFSLVCADNNTVVVYSKNDKGRSVENSAINISKESSPQQSPTNVQIFYVKNRDYSGYIYELSWNDVAEGKGNYYVFWCEKNKDHSGCINFDWKEVNETSVNISLPASSPTISYGFQIAYKIGEQSSGIQPWEYCIRPFQATPETDQGVKNLKAQVINYSDPAIEVSWDFPCERRSRDVEGFIVHWFQDSLTNKSELLDIHVNKYTINNVRAGQKYFIQVETEIKSRRNIMINISSPIDAPITARPESQSPLQTGFIVIIVIIGIALVLGGLPIIVKKVKKKFNVAEIIIPAGLDEYTRTANSPPHPSSSLTPRTHRPPNTPLMEQSKIIISDPSPSPTSSQSSGIGSVTTSELQEDQNQQMNEYSQLESHPNSSRESVNIENACIRQTSDTFRLVNEKQPNISGNVSQLNPSNNNSSLIPCYSSVGQDSSPQSYVSLGTNLIPDSKSGYMKIGLNLEESPRTATPCASNTKMDYALNMDPNDDSIDFTLLDNYSSSGDLAHINEELENVSYIPMYSVVTQQSPYKTVDYLSNLPLTDKFQNVNYDENFSKDSEKGSAFSLFNELPDSYSIIGDGQSDLDLTSSINCDALIRSSEPLNILEDFDRQSCDETDFISQQKVMDLSEANPLNLYYKVQNNDCGDCEQVSCGPNKGYVTPEKLQLHSNISSETNENPFDYSDTSENSNNNIMTPQRNYISAQNNTLFQSKPIVTSCEELNFKDSDCNGDADYVQLPGKDIQQQCSQLHGNNTNSTQTNNYTLMKDLQLSGS